MCSRKLEIVSLPDEILGRIFQKLPVEERGLLAPVSRQFQRVAEDPYYWLYMTVAGCKGSTQQVCRVLRRASFLRRLEIQDRSDANDLLACVAKHARNLNSLTMLRCRGYPGQKRPSLKAELVCRVLRRCGRLRRLVSEGHKLLGRNVLQEVLSRALSGALKSGNVQCAVRVSDLL
ncbi:hypothetical protein PR048_023212 [Dryococelus australis]|uniref:F-box domain-containing protein n=1 Tax=Dryococelus australis TaxID=614101 RepID=A0ABQ9GTG5_9NEOP|nr:hypothetical protein PR048_023212 [Dryococelus australis]